MPRESMTHKRERALEVCTRMSELYPNAECALHFRDPFSLVIAVLLSAQTTDASVNKVTPILFDRWPDAAALPRPPLIALIYSKSNSLEAWCCLSYFYLRTRGGRGYLLKDCVAALQNRLTWQAQPLVRASVSSPHF